MTKYCPNCGESLVDEAKFCKNCGEKLSNVSPSPVSQKPASESSHLIAIILGYVLALLIPLFGLIIGIYLLTRKDSSSASIHGIIMIVLALVVWFFSMIFAFYFF